ncbi:DUF481 domain-containing protein [Marivirga harenae]|uniref:DUF481 domain-containing protein n=1 Tax=Marivirga harenae TaxID=2010992 RepID=UPI0026DF5BD4|nr:DUF481 domain-containing protein [Marivirga harenae]WKV12494.1 DUF481 domain-containing protein [Marivirga harenae]
MPKIFFTIALFILSFSAVGQILHFENFAVILDTTKHITGNIVPSFQYQNLKEDLIKFENTADFSILFDHNAFTIANKVELSRFGDETFESGGYFFIEYRRIQDTLPFALEPYFQAHWNEVRGLDRKYAAGANFRWRILYKKSAGIFAGIGPFYEYERWDYRGVPDSEVIPNPANPITNEQIRLGSYISYKQRISDKFLLDLSIYYQDKIENLFNVPRAGSSSRLTYKLTKYLGLTLLYQNTYDPSPVVPIDKLYHNVTFSFSINI